MKKTQPGLLPCPFCGASPALKHIGNIHVSKQMCVISCTTPGCLARQTVGIYNGRGKTYEWAEMKCREKWNLRHKFIKGEGNRL